MFFAGLLGCFCNTWQLIYFSQRCPCRRCPFRLMPRQKRTTRRVKTATKKTTPTEVDRRRVKKAVRRRAPTPSLPEDDVPSDLPGPSCPTAPRQTRARKSVKTAVKRRAPTPLLPPSKRSTPAPLVDRWHGGAEEDVCPPQFPFCPKRTPGAQLDF